MKIVCFRNLQCNMQLCFITIITDKIFATYLNGLICSENMELINIIKIYIEIK